MKNPQSNERPTKPRYRNRGLRIGIVVLVFASGLLAAYGIAYTYHHLPSVHEEMAPS